ncbi:uncharacterized protein LOC123395055 isoform X3 [Hordeum vulgare subsp. vulgare]|uniref:uncharacterized protein LOC123395055 isoform X3 n=1 Tax=Hordeum vulgare subsp. vulgare TaxID=112509 RepID=UPI001D1A5A38|nr:uncharacterized protein LOC123395055 isoform X3 [Hordeum vulgare subsp. vulgare]
MAHRSHCSLALPSPLLSQIQPRYRQEKRKRREAALVAEVIPLARICHRRDPASLVHAPPLPPVSGDGHRLGSFPLALSSRQRRRRLWFFSGAFSPHGGRAPPPHNSGISRGMVWSHADHREGIHWCPAHQCHLCGKRRYVSQPSKVDAGWHHPGHLHDMYLIVMTSSWKASVSGALALTLPFSCSFSSGNFPLMGTCFGVVGLANAKAGVHKPGLLPKEFTTVIDVAGFLSSGQENRIRQEIEDLEKDIGYKLRVLTQNYPDTPGCHADALWTTIWT